MLRNQALSSWNNLKKKFITCQTNLTKSRQTNQKIISRLVSLGEEKLQAQAEYRTIIQTLRKDCQRAFNDNNKLLIENKSWEKIARHWDEARNIVSTTLNNGMNDRTAISKLWQLME